jgi:hypothetical protein
MISEAGIQGWRGESGTLYVYTVVEAGVELNPAFGNYIFARRNASGGWEAVYIGHGDLAERTDLSRHHMREYIRDCGATHVHIRENSSLKDRMIEKADLLEGHPESWIPTGGRAAAAL